jgi:hypothetical protein
MKCHNCLNISPETKIEKDSEFPVKGVELLTLTLMRKYLAVESVRFYFLNISLNISPITKIGWGSEFHMKGIV